MEMDLYDKYNMVIGLIRKGWVLRKEDSFYFIKNDNITGRVDERVAESLIYDRQIEKHKMYKYQVNRGGRLDLFYVTVYKLATIMI